MKINTKIHKIKCRNVIKKAINKKKNKAKKIGFRRRKIEFRIRNVQPFRHFKKNDRLFQISSKLKCSTDILYPIQFFPGKCFNRTFVFFSINTKINHFDTWFSSHMSI